MNVLIVDDSNTTRMLVRTFVEDLGHHVIEVESGEEALKCFESESIQLVLMDIKLPGIDGFETTRRIRAQVKVDWFPIIFLSSNSAESHFSEGIQAGGDAYLTKPVIGSVLQSMVKAMARIAGFHTAMQKLNSALSKLAHVDPLTGLENRRGFFSSLETEWARSKREQIPLSVILLDIDNFKLYNDFYGHLQGDECLKLVASAMRDAIKRPADLIGRFGGEEFVIMLANTPKAGATILAERVRQMIEKTAIPHEKSTLGNVVTASFGVAEMTEAENVETLLKKADERLYQAKEKGRNQVCF
jgi:diguanylate cyclase (GGDEF)-like protein